MLFPRYSGASTQAEIERGLKLFVRLNSGTTFSWISSYDRKAITSDIETKNLDAAEQKIENLERRATVRQ